MLPGVKSSRIYFVDTSGVHARAPKIHATVEPEQIHAKVDLAFPHTAHCLADGNVMISFMGNTKGEGKGGWVLINQEFQVVGQWNAKEEEKLTYGYDFWYQPRHNVLVSSEWGAPASFTHGFNPSEVPTKYGRSIYFWNYKERTIAKKVDLEEGLIPLEVRFLHNPDEAHGYVAAALSSNLIHFFKDEQGEWQTQKAVDVPAVNVEGWALPTMPSLITDFVISLDDKYVYISNWLHGDVRYVSFSF